MGGRVRAALRAVPGGFWMAALLMAVAILGEAPGAVWLAWACLLVGVMQLVRSPRRESVAPAGSGNATDRGQTLTQVVFVTVVGTAVVGGAAIGLLGGVPVWAVIGGTFVLAIVGFLVASLLTLAIAGLVQATDRDRRR